MTELRETVGNDEFVMWSRYFARKAQAEELATKEAGP